MADVTNTKVNVKSGNYSGKRWFLKIPYKLIQTDVEFKDEKLLLSQGTGFATVGHKYKEEILYKDIYTVEVKRKYSIPNIIFSVIVALLAIATGIWAILIVSAMVAFIGTTALATISYSGGRYEIPTEFKSEAEELQVKINTAIRQSRN